MGRANQQHRAAKRRIRTRPAARASTERPRPRPESSEPDAVTEAQRLLQVLIQVAAMTPPGDLGYLVDSRILTRSSEQQRLLDDQLSLRIGGVLTRLWEHGWQPADLAHVARRSDARAAGLVAALVTDQARRWPTLASAPPDWAAQLDSARRDAEAAGLAPTGSGPWRAVATQLRAGVAPREAWIAALRLASRHEGLPRLQPLTDPPSQWGRGPRPPRRPSTRPGSGHPAAGPDRARLLARVRALLAKAESTEYAPEAEALTEKAQDLITRHAIDEALLRAAGDERVEVRAIRVYVEAPYAGEKFTLLSQVAAANRCKAIWLKELSIGTLVGTPLDTDQVELLFTSLLVQGTRAMAEAGASRPGTYDRSADFRRSFLFAYAVRIGERLSSASSAAAEAYGTELVPVLRRQSEAVDETFAQLFPNVVEMSSGARYSVRGWEAGRAAADRAALVAGRIAAS